MVTVAHSTWNDQQMHCQTEAFGQRGCMASQARSIFVDEINGGVMFVDRSRLGALSDT